MDSISVTVSSRGYLVLPAKLRKEMDLGPGTRMILSLEGDRIILRPVKSFTDSLSGCTKSTFGKTAGEVSQFLDAERAER
jgi:AbrB family looped-hinge helix DNA binding protein